MKMINLIIGVWLIVLSCMSCEKDFSVDLANKGYVRLNKQEVSLTVGEKYVINAKTDSLETKSKQLTWTILDTKVATVEAQDERSAVITAVGEGTTIIKVESNDGNVKYFSDLTVGKDRVIKILAIGNSFSEDAIENYLYDLAKASGRKVMIANMYIGGSSLENHWTNASENNSAYQLRVISPDGSRNSFNAQTIEQAVSRENWDYISFQEVSQLSGIYDGYAEYLPKLLEYAKPLTTNPELKFILHQTWAYAKDSNHFGFVNYDKDQVKMYEAIVEAVWKANGMFNVDMVIPAGTAIQNARTSYIGDKFTRDGYHLNLGIGRFTAASAWFEMIFGGILDNPFVPENFSTYDMALVKNAAARAVMSPKQVTILEDFQSPPPNDFILTKPVYIDFGDAVAGGVFNHFRHPNDQRISGLRDEDNNNSEFVLSVGEPFSGMLNRGLQNVLGWPREVSGDMFFSDGIRIPQSSLVLSNLNKEQKYTFMFYGAINDDGSETQYTVIGKNQGTAYLKNDNNLGKYVVIKDIQPEDDATITIRLSAGPNNTQFAKFFGVNAMVILPSGLDVPVPENNFELTQPVYVDFGLLQAGAPFYHFAEVTSSIAHFNIPDVSGANTGFSMNITDRFTARNESGATTNTLGLPQAVSQDAFYGDKNNPTGGFTIYNLNKNQRYQFMFYGSRRDVNDNRETKYLAIGANENSALLDASNNVSNMVMVTNIQPRADGSVDIVVSAGPNNNNVDKFYYINTLIIAPIGYKLP